MTISTDYKADAFDADGPMPLALVTIDHSTFATPIRVVNNNEDFGFGGETFTAYPFNLELVNDRDDAPPRARLAIDNVSRDIVQHIRTVEASSPLSVQIDVVRMDEDTTAEVTVPNLRLVNVRADALSVSGDLELEDLTREAYPSYTFSPAEYPGLLQ